MLKKAMVLTQPSPGARDAPLTASKAAASEGLRHNVSSARSVAGALRSSIEVYWGQT